MVFSHELLQHGTCPLWFQQLDVNNHSNNNQQIKL